MCVCVRVCVYGCVYVVMPARARACVCVCVYVCVCMCMYRHMYTHTEREHVYVYIFTHAQKHWGMRVRTDRHIFNHAQKHLGMHVRTDRRFRRASAGTYSRRAPRAGAARERPRDENLRCQKNVWAGHSASGDSQTEE